MKRNTVTILLLVVVALFFAATNNFAQGQFNRIAEILVPDVDLNNGGTGNMVSGVDLDNDGRMEIYLVNDNWNDTPSELVPRIYKLENDGSNWVVVWQAVAPIPKQNTWPALTVGDMDKDGKEEIIWGVVNFTDASNLNPARVLVYESKGDGSDVMGVADGTGNYLPNSAWKITTEDNKNIRPTRFVIADPDDDGTPELIFSDRGGKSATGGYFFGVASVNNIPDNGDGSEQWTLEVSGKDFTLTANIQNKWDVAVIDNAIYFSDEKEISKVYWDGVKWNYKPLIPLLGGLSFASSQVVDLDHDGVQEIICGEYASGKPDTRLVLLQEVADTLKHTELARIGDTERFFGSACGDIDLDGELDFIFGTRAGIPDAALYRLAYRGGDIANPASYEFTTIDSLYFAGGYTNVINITNMDDDPAPEVLYTSSIPAGTFPNSGTLPVVVLDYTGEVGIDFDNLVIAPEVLINNASPEGTNMRFKPGRILNNGKTIWFLGANNTSGNRVTWILRSVDGGKTFTHNATSIPVRGAQMDAFDDQVALVAQADGKIWRTDDGGVNWSEAYSYNIDLLTPGFFDGLRVLNDHVAVAFGDGGMEGQMHFVRTEDKGLTWNEITGIDFGTTIYANFTWGNAACTIGETMWAGVTNQNYDKSWVLRTKDAGATWQTFEVPTDVFDEAPYSITFLDEMHGMMSGDSDGIVAKTTDGGETWTLVSKPDTSADCWVNAVVAVPNSNIVLAMDDIGIYYTTDLGSTWGKIDCPLLTPGTNYVYGGLFANKDFGYFFANNGIVLRFEDMLTGVEIRSGGDLPENFQLSQNYPNPFNPSTMISYTLPGMDNVTLRIYNLRGELVKTLVDGKEAEGAHSVAWDGTDLLGYKVTSGVYLYVLRSGNYQIARMMSMVK